MAKNSELTSKQEQRRSAEAEKTAANAQRNKQNKAKKLAKLNNENGDQQLSDIQYTDFREQFIGRPCKLCITGGKVEGNVVFNSLDEIKERITALRENKERAVVWTTDANNQPIAFIMNNGNWTIVSKSVPGVLGRQFRIYERAWNPSDRKDTYFVIAAGEYPEVIDYTNMATFMSRVPDGYLRLAGVDAEAYKNKQKDFGNQIDLGDMDPKIIDMVVRREREQILSSLPKFSIFDFQNTHNFNKLLVEKIRERGTIYVCDPVIEFIDDAKEPGFKSKVIIKAGGKEIHPVFTTDEMAALLSDDIMLACYMDALDQFVKNVTIGLFNGKEMTSFRIPAYDGSQLFDHVLIGFVAATSVEETDTNVSVETDSCLEEDDVKVDSETAIDNSEDSSETIMAAVV